MATFKLYPPIIAGTTPPFYATGSGTYILRVPFTMNKMVSIAEIGGVKMRIRAADTDLEIGRLDAYSYALSSEETSWADFNLASVVASIHTGKYYKIQLAYIDSADAASIGYYSTISITKCTAQPTVSIMGLDAYSSNIDTTSYTGLYSNVNDPSEKCYQYKFTLYDSDDNELDTSGWCLHNSNTDDLSTESNDYYMLNYTCEPSEKYRLQYSVITNNNLQVDGPRYLMVGSTSVAPELKADLVASIDYDNGCVHLSLDPWVQTKQQQAVTTYTGQFVVSRSSSKEDFKQWTKVVTFQLNGTLPQGTVFSDFTIEQGHTYRYALQQFNDNKIYSSRVYANDVYAAFEDMFLYDGERQLRIQYNPKVSSFKTVLQDSKKNTLGSKYPFFFRNGNVAYKEFPISGLISYMVDKNEYFLSRTDDLGMDVDWQDTTDIIDENIAFERKFKLEVMDWLNDGKVKLFRSPGEGNYLVRLINVSLTPNDSLSRMIHTFQCTADEIDSFTPRKLVDYGFLKVSESAPLELRFGSINFDEMIETIIAALLGTNEGTVIETVSQSTIDTAITQFQNSDLLNGRQCQYLKFEDCAPGRTWFSLGGTTDYLIGTTGQYENYFTDPVSNLKIKKAWRHMPGSVTYGIWTTQTSSFDTVANITQRDVIESPEYTGRNYIDEVVTTKDKIQRFYAMHFKLNDLVYEIGNWNDFCESYNLYLLTGAPDAYQVVLGLNENEFNKAMAAVEGDTTLSTEQREAQKEQLRKIRQQTQEWASDSQRIRYNTTTIIEGSARIRNNEARTYSDIFVDNALFINLETGAIYKFDANTYEFIAQPSEITVTISSYDKTRRAYTEEQVMLTPTQVCIDDEIIDLAETGYLDVPATSAVPTQLYWGALVSPTLIYQLLTIGYGVESQVNPGLGQTESLANAWKQYSYAAKIKAANTLKFKRISTRAASFVNAVPNGDYEECSYFIWNDTTLHFDRLSREARTLYKNIAINEVWIPWPYANNTQPQGGWVPSGNVFNGNSALPYKPDKVWIDYSYANATETYEYCKERFYHLLDAELAVQEKKLVLSDEN